MHHAWILLDEHGAFCILQVLTRFWRKKPAAKPPEPRSGGGEQNELRFVQLHSHVQHASIHGHRHARAHAHPPIGAPPKSSCAHSRTRVHTHRQFTHTPSTQSINTQHTRDDDTHAHTYACNLTHDDIKLDSARYSLSSSEGSWVALEQGKEVVERQILPNTKVVFAKFSPAARGGRLVQAAGRHGKMT